MKTIAISVVARLTTPGRHRVKGKEVPAGVYRASPTLGRGIGYCALLLMVMKGGWVWAQTA
jgi:hypothetical protein